MMAAMSPTAGSSCGATRQICRSLRYEAISVAYERRLGPFDKGPCGLPWGGSVAGARVMHGFRVETGFQRQPFGVVDVGLDIAERHRRPLRQRHREFTRG